MLACALGHGHQDGPLVGKVAIDRPDGYPGPLRQEVGVEAIHADLFEQLGAYQEQALQGRLTTRLLGTGARREVQTKHGGPLA